MPSPFEIRDITIDDQHWEPIASAFSCDYISIKNNMRGVIYIASDDQGVGYDQILPGNMEVIGSPYMPNHNDENYPFRFLPGRIACWLKADAGLGTGIAIVRFVR